jgi:hypothetical protein
LDLSSATPLIHSKRSTEPLAIFNIKFGLCRTKQNLNVRAGRPHHKNIHAGIVVRASRPHIADAGQLPIQSPNVEFGKRLNS